MSIVSHPLTNADLERARETSDERLEVIGGELFVTPAPIPLHQMVSRRLNRLLDAAVPNANVGLVFYAPVDVRLDEHNVVQPDLLVLLRDRAALVGDKNIAGPPTLVIEIASPSTRTRDREMKRDLYARFGVLEYWLVDPDERTVTIFGGLQRGRYEREAATSERAVSATIPTLAVDLSALIAPVSEG
jgi:Uma2 family endonuclease